MNDLVFVICNLKLNANQVKNQVGYFGVVLDDLLSRDDWIIKVEKHDDSSNFDLLNVIDNATRRKNVKKDESEKKKNSSDSYIESHGTRDDFEIQIDVNPENSKSFELKNIDNVSVGTSSNTNAYNIGVVTNSNTNNPLDGNVIDECLRNNEENKGNETSFNLHYTLTNCLF